MPIKINKLLHVARPLHSLSS